MAPAILRVFNRFNRVRATVWVLKNIVLIVNVLSLIAAVGVFSVGVYGYTTNSIVGLVSSSIPVACIVLGIFVALVSIAGCCGAANESLLFLRVYIALLSILIIAQVIIGVVAGSHKHDVVYYIEQAWSQDYEGDQIIIPQVEAKLNCCGFKTIEDRALSNCTTTQSPCFTAMRDALYSGMETMEAVAVSLGVVELVCLLAAILFNFFWKKEENTRELELLDEARRLNQAEKARAKKKQYNFENPFEGADDD